MDDNENSNPNHKISFDFKIRNEELAPQSFGKVVIFEDTSISSLIAVKTFYPSYDEQAYKKFNKIIHSYKSLSHKLFAPIIDFTTPNQETPPQIATLFISHKSLKDLLIEKRNGVNNALSDPNNIAKIVIGIVIGMKYLYQNEFFHLDLKPSNILIDENCNPLFTDYYNQELVRQNITIPFVKKKSSYSAPDYNPLDTNQYFQPIAERYDSYSFGLILFEMLSNKDIFANREPNGQLRLEIPNSINEEVRLIIFKCLNPDIQKRLSFDMILSKLRKINYKITNDVIPEIPISYIDSILNHCVVNIKLLNGELCPIDVYNDMDTLFDMRMKISEKTGMKTDDIILSRNGKPIYCCWNCMFRNGPCFSEFIYKMHDTDDFLRNPQFEMVVNIIATAPEYPIYNIYSSFRDIGPKNETSFFMVPGTIQDLCEQIVSPKRNLWILKGCHFHVKYKNRVLQPNESMIENHFESFSKVTVELDWPTYVTINNQRVRCNLDDPVQELICRFAMTKYNKTISGIPYLHKSGMSAYLDSNKTIRQHGFNENDNLNFYCFDGTFKITTYCDLSPDKKILYYDPHFSVRSLKISILMANRNWKSLIHFCFSHSSFYDDDRIEDIIVGENVCIKLTERSISEEIAGRTY